jgi:hypothetical protein
MMIGRAKIVSAVYAYLLPSLAGCTYADADNYLRLLASLAFYRIRFQNSFRELDLHQTRDECL